MTQLGPNLQNIVKQS